MPSRDYQTYAAQSIWNFFEQKPSGHPLVLMPTGTGKSHVIADFCQSVLYYFPRTRIQVLTHVKELIQQNYNKLVDAWPTAPAGIYSASIGQRDIHNSIVFGGIQSVARKPHAFGHVDLLLIDEAHLVSPSEKTTYRKYINALLQVNPKLKWIGLTATGWRLGHGKLTEGEDPLFTDVCVDMTTVDAFNWFIQEGYLLPLIPKKVQTQFDISGVHMRAGEFIQSELQNAIDKEDITRRALEECIAAAGDRRKWLIFAAGVEHAVHVSHALTQMGVPCGYVHGELTAGQRDEVLAAHKAGKFKAIANNNILTTGYDDPEIDFILCLRPTASAGLWVQMLGRGTRPVWPEKDGSNWHLWPPGAVAEGRYDLSTAHGRQLCILEGPKQNCLVYDFGGNVRRLGPINDPVIPNPKGKGGGTAPIKECPQCEVYNHASVRFCVHCGAEFSFAIKIKEAASTVDVIKDNVAPVVKVHQVSYITYQLHHRAGKPKMLRVSYHCGASGLRKFDEYVCLEHEPGYARKMAEKWWALRTHLPACGVEQALAMADKLKAPTHLQVWENRQPLPQIMSYDFTGTEFGSKEQILESAWPESRVLHKSSAPVILKTSEIEDDDIPF